MVGCVGYTGCAESCALLDGVCAAAAAGASAGGARAAAADAARRRQVPIQQRGERGAQRDRDPAGSGDRATRCHSVARGAAGPKAAARADSLCACRACGARRSRATPSRRRLRGRSSRRPTPRTPDTPSPTTTTRWAHWACLLRRAGLSKRALHGQQDLAGQLLPRSA
jgi:hypothetical protein